MLNLTKVENGKRIIDKEEFNKTLTSIVREIEDRYTHIDEYRKLKEALKNLMEWFLGELHFKEQKLEHCTVDYSTGLFPSLCIFSITIKNESTGFYSNLHIRFVLKETVEDTITASEWEIFEGGVSCRKGENEMLDIFGMLIEIVRKVYKRDGMVTS